VYWTPAPPKWDMAPTYVKQVLFPNYHGAEFNLDKSTVSANIDAGLAIDEETDREEPAKLRCHSELTFCISREVETVIVFSYLGVGRLYLVHRVCVIATFCSLSN